MIRLYGGIDPGANGALAFVHDDGTFVVSYRFSKYTIKEIDLILAKQIDNLNGILIERVGAMPGQGVSSTFKFGVSYGLMQGLVIANAIPWELVQPHKWQQKMGVHAPKATTTERKRMLKERARQIWPKVALTRDQIDAALIAEYNRRFGPWAAVARERKEETV